MSNCLDKILLTQYIRSVMSNCLDRILLNESWKMLLSELWTGTNSKYLQMTISVFFNHFLTMPHFDALKICYSGKHCEKRRNCL